jgi:hypothetical protein
MGFLSKGTQFSKKLDETYLEVGNNCPLKVKVELMGLSGCPSLRIQLDTPLNITKSHLE